MAWLIGIDEAGYGPNLGPLVITSVAVRVPCNGPGLAECLRASVRRACEADDGRLLVDDSKQVYVGPKGLAKLERGVLPVLLAEVLTRSLTLGDYMARVGAQPSLDDLGAERWYVPGEPLPVAISADDWAEVADAVGNCCRRAGVEWGPVRSAVVTAPRFNKLLDHWQNKAAVEASAVIGLLREMRSLLGAEPLRITVDRLGGRTRYAAIIQTAFPDGWVQTLRESADCCLYMVLGLEREVHLRFEPRAEAEHLPVAWASMACKYLREVCMRQFNQFWQTHVPGLEPTAGYPGDASRFFQQIAQTIRDLGLSEDHVWRRK